MTGENLAILIGAPIVSAVVSGIVAKITAVGTLDMRHAVLEEREALHYRELKSQIEKGFREIKSDIRAVWERTRD